MNGLLTNHYVRLIGEALLAGIVAFGITYQATGNWQASLIAAVLAASNKAAPPISTRSILPTGPLPPVPPNAPIAPK